MSPRDFWDKMCWEGGLYEGFEYGLRVVDIEDKPKNKKFILLMKKYQDAFLEFQHVHEEVHDALANMGFEDV